MGNGASGGRVCEADSTVLLFGGRWSGDVWGGNVFEEDLGGADDAGAGGSGVGVLGYLRGVKSFGVGGWRVEGDLDFGLKPGSEVALGVALGVDTWV